MHIKQYLAPKISKHLVLSNSFYKRIKKAAVVSILPAPKKTDLITAAESYSLSYLNAKELVMLSETCKSLKSEVINHATYRLSVSETTQRVLKRPIMIELHQIELINLAAPLKLTHEDFYNVLIRVLKNDPSLSILRQNENNKKPIKLQTLAVALYNNSHITKLSFLGNCIGDSGAIILAKLLNKNSSLKHLDLYANQIGYKGIKSIAKALSKNPPLKTLELYGNPIGYKGAQYLAKSLKTNHSLIELDLDHTQVSKKLSSQINRYLHRNNTNYPIIL